MCEIDWNATGAMLGAIGTWLLLFVALFQLQRISRISNADLIVRFNDSFFTPETRLLVTLLSNSALEFKVMDIITRSGDKDRLPYLELDAYVIDQIKQTGTIEIENWRKGYTAFEVDDLILGHLDDVGRFLKKELIDIEGAYHTFNYYTDELLQEGTPLKKMLDDTDNEGCYENIKYLIQRFTAYKSELN